MQSVTIVTVTVTHVPVLGVCGCCSTAVGGGPLLGGCWSDLAALSALSWALGVVAMLAWLFCAISFWRTSRIFSCSVFLLVKTSR